MKNKAVTIDLNGQTFGRLLVVSFDGRRNRRSYFKCTCDCGNQIIARSDSLRSGNTTSCGCLRSRIPPIVRARNGRSKHPLYGVWRSMVSRCYSPKHTSFPRYGAIGIDVCTSWRKSFETFLQDMGPRPSNRHSIERNDGSKGYSPENCRWATTAEQCSNTRSNRRLDAFGETRTLQQWSVLTGLRRETIARRLKLGWPVEDALSKPVGAPRTSVESELDDGTKFSARHWLSHPAKAA